MTAKTDAFLRNLRKIPRCNRDEFYRIADYIEMKCIASKDLSYSKSEFIDDARQRVVDLGEGDQVDFLNDKTLSKSEKNDKWESMANDAFRVIASRQVQYAGYYPFSIDSTNQFINFNNDNKLSFLYYIFLLYCANLPYTGNFKKELTSSFENFSIQTLKQIYGSDRAEFVIFGSSNTEGNMRLWESSKIWAKLSWLAEFLSVDLNVKEEHFNKHNLGDNGLDIVGKINLFDEQTHFPIIFAQCACSAEDWVDKQSSISKDKWNSFIHYTVDPDKYMFIPQSFRDSTGAWHDFTYIRNTILMDRLRLLKLFDNEHFFKNLTAFEVIQTLINTKESVY